MAHVFDLIRADASSRLALPPGRHPFEALDAYRKFLRLETHRLKMLHRGGASGRELCRARSLVLDLILESLLRAARQLPKHAKDLEHPSALVATGGYGRAELNPGSDVDLMFLHDGKGFGDDRKPAFMELLDPPVLFTLFPKVGHAVRTIRECVQVANEDLRSKTSLVEARLVCGDAGLFARFEATLLSRCVKGQEAAYIKARIADQEARRAKYGNAVCLQEPNVKNGCGGLRDYQNLLWMAFFKYGCRSLADLEKQGFISGSEREELEAAYSFLLRVRNELHYHTERAADQLTKAVQPAVAHNLGYTDRSLSRRIERFMRDYYIRARHIYLMTRTLEQRLALLPQPKRLLSLTGHFLRERRKRASYVIDGFRFVDGRVHAVSDGVFREDPARLMRVFRYAQQRGLALDAEVVHTVRRAVDRLSPSFRKDPHVHRTFLEILNQRGNVAPVLRAMHEVGLLGAYLVPFGRLTCLVQHEFFHQYTADEHTLVCLEKLDAIASTQEGALAPYGEIFTKEVEQPYVLYLAMLLHDAGKAGPGGGHHADHSGRIALSVGRRLGLEPAVARTLHLLVQHHLVMVTTSQRRDLDDPSEIRRFAALVENVNNLHLLTLLTVADSLATSDKLWNGFKDTLLMTLYRRTRELLAGGTEFIEAEARQRDRLRAQVQNQLPSGYSVDELTAHFENMPARYFPLRDAKDILADLEVAHRFFERLAHDAEDPLEPVCVWRDEPDRGYSVVRVGTWDRPGLFSKITAALTTAGLNILSADIYTRADNLALDTFLVTDAASGQLVDRRGQERFGRQLRAAVCEGADLRDQMAKRRAATPLFEGAQYERIPTAVRFDNLSSDTRTVLEVVTEDRVGLLSVLSQVLWELKVDIAVAKICTEKGAASDTFYVTELDGSKIENASRQRAIETSLGKAISRLG